MLVDVTLVTLVGTLRDFIAMQLRMMTKAKSHSAYDDVTLLRSIGTPS